jgi:hypothetical protein
MSQVPLNTAPAFKCSSVSLGRKRQLLKVAKEIYMVVHDTAGVETVLTQGNWRVDTLEPRFYDDDVIDLEEEEEEEGQDYEDAVDDDVEENIEEEEEEEVEDDDDLEAEAKLEEEEERRIRRQVKKQRNQAHQEEIGRKQLTLNANRKAALDAALNKPK